MCLCVGIEALVVLRDVCGMEAKEVEEVARRAAFALHEHPALYLPPRLLKLGLLAAVGDPDPQPTLLLFLRLGGLRGLLCSAALQTPAAVLKGSERYTPLEGLWSKM